MTGGLSTYLFGGAAIGLVTSCWAYIKTVAWKVCNLFIQRIEIKDENLSQVVSGYLVKQYKRSKLYDRLYDANYEFIRPADRMGIVVFEKFGGQSIIFWNGWFPFIWNGAEKKPANNSNSSGGNSFGSSSSNDDRVHGYLTYIRGTMNIDQIIADASHARNSIAWSSENTNKAKQRRFVIKYIPDICKDESSKSKSSSAWWFNLPHYRLINYDASDLGFGKSDDSSCLDKLIFPKHVKNLIEEVKLWVNSRDWYAARNILWKRGWLIFGVGGTGKTALARAFGEDLDLPVFVYNLAELSNYEFMKAWHDMQQYAPCIALFEDLDNVFHGRVNVAAGRRGGFMSVLTQMGKTNQLGGENTNNQNQSEFGSGAVNFDTFLNCLDGIQRAEGIFTIITTNHVDKIDAALGQPRKKADGSIEFISTRPGRIDKAIELTYMELGDKHLMAEKILGDCPEELHEMKEYLVQHGDEEETPAQFQERCAQIALRSFWDQQLGPEPLHQYVLVTNEDNQTPATEKVATNA